MKREICAASAANPYIVAPMSALAPAPAPTPADRWGERLPRRLGLWSAVAAVIRPGAYGAISITSSAYTLRVLGVDPAGTVVTVAGQAIRAEQLLAAAYVGIVALVNYVGIHRAAILQNVSTALKVGALAALVLL